MRDEDIKRLLRELAERAEADGQVRSPKVRINFDPEEEEPAQEEASAEKESKMERRKVSSSVKERKAAKQVLPDEQAEVSKPAKPAKPAEDVPADEPTGTPAAEEAGEDIPKGLAGGRKGKFKLPSLMKLFSRAKADDEDFLDDEEPLDEKEDEQIQEKSDLPAADEPQPEAVNGKEPAEEPADEPQSPETEAADAAPEKKEQEAGDDEAEQPAPKSGEDEAKQTASEEPEQEASETGEASQEDAENPEDKAKDEKSSGKTKKRASKERSSKERSSKERASKKARVKKAPHREGEEFHLDAADFMDPVTEKTEEPQLGFKERMARIGAMLEEKGMGRREWALIGAAVVMVLLVAVVVIPLATRKKIRSITTEDGLKISVNQEPEEWCSSGEVTLTIVTETPMQSILINNLPVAFEGSTKTEVTVPVEARTMDVMVVCEDKVLTASVEIPMLDDTVPVLSISKEAGVVTLEATDEQSGIESIWYGEVEAFSDVPAYKQYTEPFAAQSDAVYACYAVDLAGHASTPIVSNLVRASSISIAAESLTMFPGEQKSLELTFEPAMSYVNGLTVVSSDPSVASVDANGMVTALSKGRTDITVSADGIVSRTCKISVVTEAQVTISTIGDLTLGDDINFSPLTSFSTVAAMNGDTYFFNNVRSILEADDLTFGNLEGALSEGGTRKDKQYAFRGSTEYTKILNDGSIEVVTLANNHSSDYGDAALQDTKAALTEAGIGYCEGDDFEIREVNGIKTALIGIYALENGTEKMDQLERTIAAAKEQGARLVAVAFHWGAEMQEVPDQYQVTMAHAAIDNGADLVVGHHPHVLQGIEEYNGKYIAYSLANFCFGGNSNPSDMDTMIFQVTFDIDLTGTVTGSKMNIVPCSVSSDAYSNNYQPTPATGDEADRIMSKLRERSASFGTQF